MVFSMIMCAMLNYGDKIMVKQCEICDKKSLRAKKISFSNKHHIYKQKPNLQPMKIEINGTVKKVLVCTSCIKANKVRKVV